jgi:hypothetical protein
MTTPIWMGRCEPDGQLRLDSSKLFRSYVATLAGPVEVIVRRRRTKRSARQNNYYWGVIIKTISGHTGYDFDECHELLALRFLPREECPLTHMPRRLRTPERSTKEFSEYCENIRVFAASTLGLVIPDPHDTADGED